MWTCLKCGKSVEPTFDICWSCGTSKDGAEDSRFGQADVADEPPAPEPKDTTKIEEHRPSAKIYTCRACGSTKIIPNVYVLDQGKGSDGYLQVVVYGEPQALIFKDRVYGHLRAWICGNCSFTELRVKNPEELYQKYLEAKERGSEQE
jgi:rubrerythrin